MTLSRAAARLTRPACLALALALAAAVAACGGDRDGTAGLPTVVVTFPLLGAVVSELVGDAASVQVLMRGDVDPHDWSPSARDIEAVSDADLVVANGLDLEAGLADALDEAEGDGTPVFYATDHIEIRELGDHDDGHDEGDGGDPHFWVDPVSMREVVLALDRFVSEETTLELGDRAGRLADRLTVLDAAIRERVATIPAERRKLVTGHESFGYFADRYGFELVGNVVPASTSQAEPSAAQVAELAERIARQDVDVVFTEIGTPDAVVRAVADESGARIVELPSHTLPDDGSYFTFVDELVDRIGSALAG